MTDPRPTPRIRGARVPYQLFMLCLCVLALVGLAAEVAMPMSEDTRFILAEADLVLCVFFLADFLWSLVKADNRWRYFVTWGWIDLLSSVPAIGVLRAGRVLRVVRILRLFRAVRSLRTISEYVLARRAQSAFLAATLISIVLLFSSSIAIIDLERGGDANIQSPEDAIWWSFVTMTTVGYGDRYPVTTGGRIVAGLLMIAGVGVFGTFTGLVASWFVESGQEESGDRVAALQAEVVALRQQVGQRPDEDVP